MDVKHYRFRPPLETQDGPISSVSVVELDGGDLFDLFDQNDFCLNLGCTFPFIPTYEEVREFCTTGKIKGKIE